MNDQSNRSYESEYLQLSCLLSDSYDLLNQAYNFTDNTESKGDYDIEEEKHKEFSISEAYAICDPGTVVIHI